MGPQPFFSVKQSKQIWKQYQRGLSREDLAKRYNVSWKAITNAIRRVGGKMRPKATPVTFSKYQAKNLRREYETFIRPDGRPASLLQMGKKYGTNGQTILAAIIRAGGRAKPQGETSRKHSTERFQRIFKRYGWMEDQYWAIWSKQRGRCFWCHRRLPRTSACVVDHKDIKSRGLSCPDNQCNLVAGHLETAWNFSLDKIKRVLRRAA